MTKEQALAKVVLEISQDNGDDTTYEQLDQAVKDGVMKLFLAGVAWSKQYQEPRDKT